MRKTVRGRVNPERFVPKLNIPMKKHRKEEGWDPVCRAGHPCADQLPDSYLTFVLKEQTRVGIPVNQTAPKLDHTPMYLDLLNDMNSRVQVASSLADTIFLMRGIAQYKGLRPLLTLGSVYYEASRV